MRTFSSGPQKGENVFDGARFEPMSVAVFEGRWYDKSKSASMEEDILYLDLLFF